MSQIEDKSTLLYRMLDVSSARLNRSKLQSLLYLRQKLIDTANAFVHDIFEQEPLACNPTKKELQETLLEKQKQVKGLNKGYAEKARRQAQNVVSQAHAKYFRRLPGRLAHASERIQQKNAKKPGTFCMPIVWGRKERRVECVRCTGQLFWIESDRIVISDF